MPMTLLWPGDDGCVVTASLAWVTHHLRTLFQACLGMFHMAGAYMASWLQA
jgi:hypothetical protein